jgi:hypothetical protein
MVVFLQQYGTDILILAELPFNEQVQYGTGTGTVPSTGYGLNLAESGKPISEMYLVVPQTGVQFTFSSFHSKRASQQLIRVFALRCFNKYSADTSTG